ncbi:MAG: DUF885 domain-containing protein [Saprospiraceae bacterium]|nr:DUF885 domain-containing protein [Saprospiraceae bacterium]
MKYLILLLCIVYVSCQSKPTNTTTSITESNVKLAKVLAEYFDQRMSLLPLEATANGYSAYNHLLPADFTDSYRVKLCAFFTHFKNSISPFESMTLNETDQKSLAIFKYEINMALEGLDVHFLGSSALSVYQYVPFDQFNGLPLTLGQMGSGVGNQPFKTVQDYENWLQRAKSFPAWADSAIVYFKKGIERKEVLPRSIVQKMIPQMKGVVTIDASQSLFYGPVKMMPEDFSEADKNRFTQAYTDLILKSIVPTYQKLGDFLENEYLPAARSGTGINEWPEGNKLYQYLVKYWTTTNQQPEEIYQSGLSEVKRIREEMESIKNQLNFKGTLNEFFDFMRTDPQFMPYRTAEEILEAFRNIQKSIDPHLQKMFTLSPKTKFEIRQTEAFRAASASAEYYPGLPDGSRPGIFYVPIVDASKFNTTSGMESLFLHEAIPGHHYQISIQSENESLPAFRRFIWYGAYGEGYALYCESLGKELGLYTDPYQHMGALGEEMHRAIRLAVDVAMHTGKITREEAITYSMQNEAISEDAAIAEIERYMVYPAQALSYKTGELKIKALRKKYESSFGSKFDIAAFHTELLKDGCLPLETMESTLDQWAENQRGKN